MDNEHEEADRLLRDALGDDHHHEATIGMQICTAQLVAMAQNLEAHNENPVIVMVQANVLMRAVHEFIDSLVGAVEKHVDEDHGGENCAMAESMYKAGIVGLLIPFNAHKNIPADMPVEMAEQMLADVVTAFGPDTD